jgi:predicted nucleotide-binding protein
MTSETDLFEEINKAVLDLQAANLQSYSRPLKRLGRLLRHKDLIGVNERLLKGIDLDAFLKKGHESRRGMVGSARLDWPDDDQTVLGLQLALILKFGENPDFISDFGHDFFYNGPKIMSGINAVTGQLIIPFARDYKTFVHVKNPQELRMIKPQSKKVFIVHGHDEASRYAVARFLEKIGFEAVILSEQPNQGRTVIEKFEVNADVGFAIVLLTPDDVGGKKGAEYKPRARQNVILELGYFIGKLGRARVCALRSSDIEIPSDILGVVWTPYDAHDGWQSKLAKELQAAGYEIDWNKIMGN